jgi:hypothetical protein
MPANDGHSRRFNQRDRVLGTFKPSSAAASALLKRHDRVSGTFTLDFPGRGLQRSCDVVSLPRSEAERRALSVPESAVSRCPNSLSQHPRLRALSLVRSASGHEDQAGQGGCSRAGEHEEVVPLVGAVDVRDDHQPVLVDPSGSGGNGRWPRYERRGSARGTLPVFRPELTAQAS